MRALDRTTLALVALFALTLALRLGGLDKLLPHLEEADPGLVVQVKLMREGIAPDPVAHKAYLAYPTLLARPIALLPEARAAAGAPLAEHLAAASADFVRVRGWIALLSCALVPLTWLVARRFLGAVGAFTAAACVALSLTHLLFSQQARPHGAHATVALAAVLAQLAWVRTPTTARGAASALLCALAVSCLHTGVFTLPPLLVAWWLTRREGKRASPWPLALAIALCALAVWQLYPRAPRLENDGGTLEFGGHTLHWDRLDFAGAPIVARVLSTYEPALTIAALLGVLALLVRARKLAGASRESRGEALVLCAYALPYTLALCLFGETVDRFLLPLIPYLALLAGAFVELASSRLVRAALCALVLAFPAYVTTRYVAVRAEPDTFEQTASWLEQHAAGARVLASPRMTLPAFLDAESLAFAQRDGTTRKRPWIGYQLADGWRARAPGDADTLALFLAPAKLVNQQPPQADASVAALLDEVRPRYVALENSKLMTILPGVVALRAEVARRGVLAATFSGEPERDCLERPIDFQEIDDFVRRLLRARAFGPCVEIYELEGR